MKKQLLFKVILSLILLLGLNMSGKSQVVISQVYGGGGNSGATLKNDFIELFNRGTTTVNLNGWSVQYTSANGTFGTIKTDLSSFNLAPGQYYLIQEAAGTGGTTDLPTPDLTGTIALSGTAGKVALVNTTTFITVACPTDASIVDFVAFGLTPTCFEGTGPTPAPSNTTAIIRISNGCTDDNNNATDFIADVPNPRNSASTKNICGAATPTATDLFFSEYVEGSFSNKVIEIFNGTGADVDLSAYSIKQSYNGEGWGIRGGLADKRYVLPLTGTITNGDVYVIYNDQATLPKILSEGDLKLIYDGVANNSDGSNVAAFNGNDALGLFKNNVLIDVIGDSAGSANWNVAGIIGAAVDHTIVRKNTVNQGNTNWVTSAGTNVTDSEWNVFPMDTVGNLGSHTFGVPIDVTAPILTASPKNGDTEVAINTHIVLTFDEPIRNIDDSEITNTNVADLLTLKETDASGVDVLFTATIDAAKRVITVIPTAALTIGTVYYGAIAPVEDASNNATAASNMTFTTITKYVVTFNVDMSLVKAFNPLTDTVYISGDMAGLAKPGSNHDLMMKDPDGNMIYTLSLPLDIPVGDIAYKFYINAGWDGGEWTAGADRTATITENTTLNHIFGNRGEPVFVNIPYAQNFEYSTANSSMALAGWTNTNVAAGGVPVWISKEYASNKYGQVTSNNSTSTGADQIWLITPGIIMPDTIIADLTFDVNVGYWTYDGLTIWISTDFDQTVSGITTATWTDVTREFTIPSAPATGYGTFTNAGHLDVSSYTGNMYVAFVYNGNKTASQTTTYQIDNVAVRLLGYVGLNKMSKSAVNIYPNPSNGRLQITNPSNETQEIAVFNSLGKQVKSAVSAKGIISLDITAQAKGFYLVRITNKANNSVQYKKIVLN